MSRYHPTIAIMFVLFLASLVSYFGVPYDSDDVAHAEAIEYGQWVFDREDHAISAECDSEVDVAGYVNCRLIVDTEVYPIRCPGAYTRARACKYTPRPQDFEE